RSVTVGAFPKRHAKTLKNTGVIGGLAAWRSVTLIFQIPFLSLAAFFFFFFIKSRELSVTERHGLKNTLFFGLWRDAQGVLGSVTERHGSVTLDRGSVTERHLFDDNAPTGVTAALLDSQPFLAEERVEPTQTPAQDVGQPGEHLLIGNMIEEF